MQSYNAVGRRKTSVARVIVRNGSGTITVNRKPIEKFFPKEISRSTVTRPLHVTETEGKYDVLVNVNGGGVSGQASAISLGIARALVKISEEYRSSLRKFELLTRDPRMVERKKYGLHKARRATQFSKR